MQTIHGEDARKGGRIAYHRMLQGGAVGGGVIRLKGVASEHAATRRQAIPLEDNQATRVIPQTHVTAQRWQIEQADSRSPPSAQRRASTALRD